MRRGKFSNRLLWLFSWWLFLGGLSALAVGIGFGLYTSLFLLRSSAANGTVLRLDAVPDNEDGTTNYAPVFSFVAADGRTYTLRSGVATKPPEFEEREAVRVLYIKSDPGNAKLDSFWQLWFVTLICCLLGAFFGVPGCLLVRYARKRRREALAAASAMPMFPESRTNAPV